MSSQHNDYRAHNALALHCLVKANTRAIEGLNGRPAQSAAKGEVMAFVDTVLAEDEGVDDAIALALSAMEWNTRAGSVVADWIAEEIASILADRV